MANDTVYLIWQTTAIVNMADDIYCAYKHVENPKRQKIKLIILFILTICAFSMGWIWSALLYGSIWVLSKILDQFSH